MLRQVQNSNDSTVELPVAEDSGSETTTLEIGLAPPAVAILLWGPKHLGHCSSRTVEK